LPLSSFQQTTEREEPFQAGSSPLQQDAVEESKEKGEGVPPVSRESGAVTESEAATPQSPTVSASAMLNLYSGMANMMGNGQDDDRSADSGSGAALTVGSEQEGGSRISHKRSSSSWGLAVLSALCESMGLSEKHLQSFCHFEQVSPAQLDLLFYILLHSSPLVH
jgi:hypothetical protein